MEHERMHFAVMVTGNLEAIYDVKNGQCKALRITLAH